MRALLLHIGEDLYAVAMERAREVVAAPEVTPLPTAPSSVLGVCNLRGEIIPVFDTGSLLGLGPMGPFDAVTVIETDLGPAGLATTVVGESAELGESVSTTETPGTTGAHVLGSRVAVLIDVDALLSPVRVG